RVWDAATGMQLTAPLAHQGPVRAVAVGRSGCRVLTAAADGFVRVWEVVPGDVPAARFAVGKVSSARLSPDGRRAVTVRRDGTLLWAARLVSETSSSGSMTVDRGEAQL